MINIVGWNDILGFQSVLEHVTTEWLQDGLIPLLDDVRLNRVGKNLMYSARYDDVCKCLKSVRSHVISDTIAVTCPIQEPAWASWLAFLTYSATLHASMFDMGLPMRGAVAIGDAVTTDWCVLGKPVVRAHKTCEDLDIAACCFLPEAVDAMHTAFSAPEAPRSHSTLTGWYGLPTKSLPQQNSHQLVQVHNLGFFHDTDKAVIADYVARKFSAHGKTMDGPGVHRKVANTIAFLQWNRALWMPGGREDMLSILQRLETTQQTLP